MVRNERCIGDMQQGWRNNVARIRTILLLLIGLCLIGLCALTPVSGAGAQTPPPADGVFTLAAERDGANVLTLRWRIAEGNYLYRDHFQASYDGHQLPLDLPAGEDKDDPNFGLVQVYHHAVETRLRGLPGAGRIEVRFQGCAEQGICYPPLAKIVDLATLDIADLKLGLGGAESTSPATAASEAVPAQASPAVAATDETRMTSLLRGNTAAMLAAFLGFGLLLSLTPCVFPMIPILSAILAGRGGSLSMRRGFILSASYVLAMAAAYGLVGLAAGWTGANLQAALQTPWALGLAAAAFVLLALSMFGLFDLALPASLATRLTGTGSRSGSIAGAALLGFGSALIVGPCVTPPLAAALLYAVQTGEATKGAAALFALGFGMGLPLIVVGTFGARILPKAGPWLDRTKQIFGAVFIAIATMLIARLLPGPAVLTLYGGLAVAAATFLGGFDRLRHASSWVTRCAKAAGLVVAVYGVTLIVGAAGGANDPLRPLGFLTAPSAEMIARSQTRVASLIAFEQAVASARTAGRPILISFTADWCTVCKSNEAVMNDPAIRQRLNELPIIAADVTSSDENTQALMTRFAVIGPPTIFLLDANGQEIAGSRLIGPITAQDISRRLAQAGA